MLREREKKREEAIHMLRLIISPGTKTHCRPGKLLLKHVLPRSCYHCDRDHLKSDKRPQHFHSAAFQLMSLIYVQLFWKKKKRLL